MRLSADVSPQTPRQIHQVPGGPVVVLGHGAWGPFVEALKAP